MHLNDSRYQNENLLFAPRSLQTENTIYIKAQRIVVSKVARRGVLAGFAACSREHAAFWLMAFSGFV
jgi:hypothetical protein